MDSTKVLSPWELHPKVSSSALAMVLVNLIIGELQNRLGVHLLAGEVGLLTLAVGIISGYLAPVLPASALPTPTGHGNA